MSALQKRNHNTLLISVSFGVLILIISSAFFTSKDYGIKSTSISLMFFGAVWVLAANSEE